MSQLLKNLVFAALGLMLVLAPAAAVQAQAVKPVVVVSIAPIEKQRSDLLYLAELVGQKDVAEGTLNLAPIFLSGIDMKRPSGGYGWATENGEFKFVAFVPVTKLDTVLKNFEEKIGKPSDAGDGVKQLDPPTGEPVFIKEVKGWAFVSNEKDNLDSLPADPVKLLGNLPTIYNLAVRANVHDIPQELRQTAVDAIQAGLDQGLENNPNPEVDRELTEKVSRMSLQQITQMIEEVNDVTMGWGVDKALKATYVDFTITAVDGTSMARQMALLKDTTSNFAGFLLPGASLNANASTRLSPDQIAQNTTVLELLRDRASKEIDNDAGLDANQRTTAKDLLTQLFGVLTDTVKGGKIDYGAALMLDEKKLSFAAGILVADGKKLEAAFAKLVELAKNEPDFPEVKLNSGKLGTVNLHTIAVELPEGAEEEARELFGDTMKITIGTGPKAVYVAFGKDGEGLMKKAIDASTAKAQAQVPPSQLNVFLKPIMKFVASMDSSENPQLQAAAEAVANSEAGSDEINLFSKAIPNGVLGRLQVNEGVLRLIGDAAKAVQEAQ